jgi:hypothetical protein
MSKVNNATDENHKISGVRAEAEATWELDGGRFFGSVDAPCLAFLPPLRSPFLYRCPDGTTYSVNVPNPQPSAEVSSHYDPPLVNPKYRVQCVFF